MYRWHNAISWLWNRMADALKLVGIRVRKRGYWTTFYDWD